MVILTGPERDFMLCALGEEPLGGRAALPDLTLQKLHRWALIENRNGAIVLTDAGRIALGSHLGNIADNLAYWASRRAERLAAARFP